MTTSENETTRADLQRLLRTRSVQTGKTFTLASGRESDFFIDCKQSILSGRGHRMAGLLLLRELREHFPVTHAVAGVELGGCPLASAVALLSYVDGRGEIDALYVRKEPKDHGTAQLIEGAGSVPAAARVVVLEDVVTSGSSSLRTVRRLADAGYDVQGVIALVDRQEGAAEAFLVAQLPFYSIYRQAELRP